MIRKVISNEEAIKETAKAVVSEKVAEKPVKAEEISEQTTPEKAAGVRTKKFCQFCQSKIIPSYTDTNVLRRFTTDRAKIVPRTKSGLCSKHQRGVAKEIKYARHLSLLPFTPKI